MRPIYRAILSTGIVFLASADASAQWLKFNDESSSRVMLTSVATNDSEEKDIAVGDLNKDGWDDIVVVRKNPFSNPGGRADLLLINDNGVLRDSTTTYAPEFISNPSDARDVIIHDLDGDGWEDVAIANTFAEQPIFYRNQGNDSTGAWLGLVDESATRFPNIVSPIKFCALWAGDLTGDGAPEIYFANYDPDFTALDVLFINDGNGFFTDESQARLDTLRNSAFATGVEIHDVDNDGDNDIIKTSTLLNTIPPWNDIGVFIIFNDSTGWFSTYQKVPSTKPYMFTLGHLNADSLIDIYVVDDEQDYVNLATAAAPDSFVTYSTTVLSASPRTANFGGNSKLADIDNDGDLDLGLADVDVDIPPCNSLRQFALLKNNGGDFSDPYVSDEPWHNNAFDFDFIDINRDGKLDLFFGVCAGYEVWVRDRPGPVADCEATAGDGAVTISWPSHADNSISYYNVYRSTVYDTLSADSTAFVIPPDTSHADSTVTNGQMYYYWITAVDTFGCETAFSPPDSAWPSVVTAVGEGTPQRSIALLQNFPNPFNPSTNISFYLPAKARVELVVYDVTGRRVATLDNRVRAAGDHRVAWDGRNDRGNAVGSGIYFYRLQTGQAVLTRKMVLMK